MSIAFDGPTKRINLSAGTTTMSVADCWSRFVDWYLTPGDNSKYLPAFSTLGGDDIDPGLGTKVPLYAFLTNGWRIKPQEASHTLSVGSGILLVDGGGDPFVDTNGNYVVRINYQQPVQAITVNTGGTTAPTQQQIRDAMALATGETPAAGSVDADLAAIKTKTGNLPATPADETTGTAIRAKTDNIPTDPATAAAVAAIPTDPLLTTDTRLDRLDATISSRSTYAGGTVASVTGAVGSVTGLTASDVAAIKASTDPLTIAAIKAAIEAGDLATVKTLVDAIKAKTDSLTFTQPNRVDSHLVAINDETIAGHGTEEDPWRPA